MCYIVFLSTSSPEDLSAESTDLVRFGREHLDNEVASMLAYEHKWYVGSASGCSCTFRHLMSPELGFGRPEDWFPEERDAIEATAAFVAVVRRMLDSGYQVDCIDAWAGAERAGIIKKDVDLSAIADEEFRFFENHHFAFTGR